MRKKILLPFAVAALAVIGLASCSSGSSSNGYGTSPSQSPSQSSSPSSSADAASSATLSTASTSLGTIVVDNAGMTVYVFDNDTANSGMSTCTGTCAATWPAVTTTSTTPTMSGVSGTVATIQTSDGKNQVTLDGHPLYYFVNDTAAGDVKGQGVQGIWWVVAPDGTKITTAPSGSSGY